MANSTKNGGAKSSKKNRKFDRNRSSASNKNYIAQGRKEKNKIRKLNKHIKKYPNDKQAAAALSALKAGA